MANEMSEHPETGSDYNSWLQAAGLTPGQHWCELSPDALICLDEQWRLLFINRAAQDMFEAADALVVGQPPWQCVSLLTVLEELHLDTLKPEGPDRRTIRQVELRRAGAPVFEVAVSVAGTSSRRIFAVCIRDVSRKTPSPETLFQSQRRQLVGSLAGGVAHDFNNILTAVICQLDLVLLDKALPAKTREALSQALQSARRGAELNTKLLQFSRHTDARPAPVALTRLVEETVFLLRRGIDRRIQIHLDAPESGLWVVSADEGQLMQALMNLCLNARDAMPKGGGLFLHLANRSFSPQEARLPRHAGEFVQISVRDTGHGMTPEVLARLFEPYFTTKEFGKGAGLGLSIANHVVVENGGWIEVESEPGRGSEFHVFLPRAVQPAPAKNDPALPNVAVGAALEGHETVLVVDDEQPVREVIRAMLSFRGYQVLEAGDGTEAIEQVRSSGGAGIHLVLLDIQMPRMNGWDTLERIRELNPRLPVLLLSGGMAEPSGAAPASARPAGVLHKPFASADLLHAVRKVFDAVPRADS